MMTYSMVDGQCYATKSMDVMPPPCIPGNMSYFCILNDLVWFDKEVYTLSVCQVKQ